ncbi:hypothetical protein GCM10011494_02880 [Novosphingobium endophyticum]|uniref:Uncharacterized protein n=1 Tax=Novosphingobium endophyticum TaxID=1955250 RepID=A0A916TP18_9SPHN|nr:hypothetical protein [Novosphingobium endophyticum]GGB87963.1 hypothetical protein GCM10011494_02880 [Novosphingobium endophyticum]
MTDPTLSPLVNDPERDATPALRGYSYQILRTIEAWLVLPIGEILVIEGAEDLDRISPDGALVEQVKDTSGSGSVTLRSIGAIEAIGNLFDHQARNDGVAIRFRFLTTSSAGMEKGDPMALGRPALEAWEEVRRNPQSKAAKAAAEAIRTFLATIPGLAEKPKKWIASATTAEFIKRIVDPIEWVTGQGDIISLTARLEVQLIELGETRNLSTADAVRALDALHRHVWTVATDAKREPLRRGDLLRIVDQAGRTSIPTEQLVGLLAALAPGGGGSTAITAATLVEAPPQRPPRHLDRPTLKATIAGRLAAGAVVVHGGTGMGKTDLAADVAREAGRAGWINLRDADAVIAAGRIRAVAAVASSSGGMTVVLDDLEPGDDPRPLEAALADLNATLRRHTSVLVVTSSQPLPPRLATALGLDRRQQLQAPPIEDDEIDRYLLEQGCPRERANSWSKLIWATTGGHPQLVNARVAALEQAGFPKPSYTDLTQTSEDAVNVRKEARRMVSSLPGAHREMLCRISLMSGRQPRSRLLRVAAIEPPIESPGDVLDRLAGPWLELTASTDLRASPLLRDLGVESRGQRWATGMHADIAEAYVDARSLTATDVSSILLHCVIGETARPLVRIMPSLLQASSEVWKQVGESAGIFARVGVEASLSAPFRDPVDLAIFRILQFRIAAERDEAEARAVLERAIEESADAGEDADFFVLLLLWQAIQNEDLALDPVTRVRHALRFARVAERIRAALPARMAAAGVESEGHDWPPGDTLAAFGALAAIHDADGLDCVLNELDALSPSDAQLLLSGLGSMPGFGSIALTRVWITEIRRTPPRWPFLSATLERLVAAARKHGAIPLATAAATLLVRVIDENLKDPAAAEAAADRLLADLGDAPRLLAAKAKVLWRSGREAEGLAIYDDALPRFDNSDPDLVDAARDAAVAAARIQDWDQSATLFRRALAADASLQAPARLMGLRGDLALSLQLAGRTDEAVEALTSAAAPMFDATDEPGEPTLSTWQRVNEAAKMILADFSGETPLDPAAMSKAVGMCSSLEPFDWMKATAAPLDIVLHNVAALDAGTSPVPAVAFRLQDRIRHSSNLLLKCVSGTLLFELDVRRTDVSGVVADAVAQVTAIAAKGGGTGDPNRLFDLAAAPVPSADQLEFVRARIIAALFAMASRGELDRVPFQAWRETMPADETFQSTRDLVDWSERMLTIEPSPWTHLFPTPPTWEQHVVGALAAVVRQRLSPDQLLICHALWGNYLRHPLINEMTAAAAAIMVTEQWLDRCDSPAQLVIPRLSVPAIRAAATSGTIGWNRVRAVIAAASNAVSIETRRFAATALGRMAE